MVSMAPQETDNGMKQRPMEDPFVEQFYPREMSWYAPEGPQGRIAEVGRWIRENPWPAIALGFFAGVLTAQIAGPSLWLAGRAAQTLCPSSNDER